MVMLRIIIICTFGNLLKYRIELLEKLENDQTGFSWKNSGNPKIYLNL
jgi:hypothetical protein